MDAVTFHESDDRLELYALGRLPDSEIQRIEEHLLICNSCRDRLEDAESFALSMRDALKSQPLTPFFPGWFRSDWFSWLKPQNAMLGAFAAALLAVGLFWVANGSRIAPVASLQLTATRGSGIPSASPARELDLFFTDAVADSRLDVVDASGAAVWTGTLTPADSRVEAKVKQAMSPGDYFARVFTPSGQMVHEYAFKVK